MRGQIVGARWMGRLHRGGHTLNSTPTPQKKQRNNYVTIIVRNIAQICSEQTAYWGKTVTVKQYMVVTHCITQFGKQKGNENEENLYNIIVYDNTKRKRDGNVRPR